MILSHRLGAVLVRDRKVAGTSVEISLSTHCGRLDVITPLDSPDEDLRQSLGGQGPQHYLMPWKRLRPKHLRHMIMKRRRPHLFDAHTSASKVRRFVGEEMWSEYLTFTIVRNPWDRIVSLYFFRSSQFERYVPFSRWLRSEPRSHLSTARRYMQSGEVIVDRAIRYERLTEELAGVWQDLDIGTTPQLPRAKGGIRPKRTRDWRAFYSDDDALFVAEVCCAEIDLFGYSFDAAS